MGSINLFNNNIIKEGIRNSAYSRRKITYIKHNSYIKYLGITVLFIFLLYLVNIFFI